MQLCEHLDQVKAGALPQPVQVLLPRELLFEQGDLSVSSLAKIVSPGANRAQLKLELAQVAMN